MFLKQIEKEDDEIRKVFPSLTHGGFVKEKPEDMKKWTKVNPLPSYTSVLSFRESELRERERERGSTTS